MIVLVEYITSIINGMLWDMIATLPQHTFYLSSSLLGVDD